MPDKQTQTSTFFLIFSNTTPDIYSCKTVNTIKTTWQQELSRYILENQKLHIKIEKQKKNIESLNKQLENEKTIKELLMKKIETDK
jgi:hypothetical protein